MTGSRFSSKQFLISFVGKGSNSHVAFDDSLINVAKSVDEIVLKEVSGKPEKVFALVRQISYKPCCNSRSFSILAIF